MTPASLEAVRQVLPAWVIWLPFAAPLLAAPISWFLASLGAYVAERGLRSLPADAHWTERARHLFPVRRTVLLTAFLPALATAPLAVGGPVSAGRGVVLPLVVAVSLLCVIAVAFDSENHWVRPVPVAVRARSLLALALAGYSGLLAPLVLVLFRLPYLGEGGHAGGLLLAVAVSAAFTFGGGLLAARALKLVLPAPERLRAALARALPTGARAPRLFTLRALSVNALALPWLGTVLVTEGALEHLDDDGLAAVLAHELEHLREPQGVRALRAAFALATGVVLPATIFLAPVRPLAALAVVIVYFAAAVGFRHLVLAMERRSDAAAGASSPAYAAALEAAYRANLVPAVLPRRASHPNLVERMAAAGVTPEWPVPPRPPSPFPAFGTVAFLTFILVLGFSLARLVIPAHARDERGHLVAVAIAGRATDLGRLGKDLHDRGAYAEAAPLLHAAAELQPWEAAWASWEAHALARAGRCQEASVALAAAAARSQGDPNSIGAAQLVLSACVPR